MIQLKTLAEKLQDELNKVANGDIDYRLFVDTGKFLKASRTNNSVITHICGLYTNQTSNISNAFTSQDTEQKGLTVATMTNIATFVIPCLDDEDTIYSVKRHKDGTTEKELQSIGTTAFLQAIRGHIDTVASKNLYYNIDGYDIAVAFTIAETGTREQLPELGDCFTFAINCFYNIIEGGDNSRNWLVWLDGNIVPYSSFSIDRQTTQETTVYANRGRNTSTQTIADTFACAIEVPALAIDINNTIKKFCINGDDGNAHIMKYTLGYNGQELLTGYKVVVFTSATMTASGVLNVGTKIQLNETAEPYGLIAFDSSIYNIYKATSSNSVLTLDNDFIFCIYKQSTYTYKFYTKTLQKATTEKGDLLIVYKSQVTDEIEQKIFNKEFNVVQKYTESA